MKMRSLGADLHTDIRTSILSLLHMKRISLAEAITVLSRSRSQIYKMLRAYRISLYACENLGSDRTVPKRGFPVEVREMVLSLIRSELSDYGPTLIADTLAEEHNLRISRETIRQWMLKANLWIANRALRRKLHLRRKRRECVGELVQIDGSMHDWFEGRNSECNLMAMVDDATGELQALLFTEVENLSAYFRVTYDYIARLGVPVRILTDGIAKKSEGNIVGKYSALLNLLGVVHSQAHSPQSKGRVERLNRTLQDRLCKEMRRRNISNISDANEYLPKFILRYNAKFSKRTSDTKTLLRKAPRDIDLIFSIRSERKVSRCLTLSYKGVQYSLQDGANARASIGNRVDVFAPINGNLRIFSNDQELPYDKV